MPFSTRSALALAMMASLTATTATAELLVTFSEGAPKDSFRFQNTGACALSDVTVALDLAPSQGGLIFDVTSHGAGVEVFQPFDLIQGADALHDIPVVKDGQTALNPAIANLAPNAAITFTIDVDDTKGSRAITVSGAEISGARVSVAGQDFSDSAVFSTTPVTRLALPACHDT